MTFNRYTIGSFFALTLTSTMLVGGPLTVTEEQEVDFGKTYQGSANCTVDFDGTLGGDCFGFGSQGLIRVSGDPNMALDVNLTTSRRWTGDLRLTMDIPKKNQFPYVTDAAGELIIPVSGRLQMRNNIVGTYRMQYTITVFYQ